MLKMIHVWKMYTNSWVYLKTDNAQKAEAFQLKCSVFVFI